MTKKHRLFLKVLITNKSIKAGLQFCFSASACLLLLAEGIKLTEKAIINQMDECFVPGHHPAGSVGYQWSE